MKLSNVTAKLTCMKQHAFQILATAAIAGAALTIAAPAAQAEHVIVRGPVGIHGPIYVAPRGPYGYAPIVRGPVYGGPVYGPVYGRPYGYDHFRYEHYRHEEYRHDYRYDRR